jgi:hypothetical protein
MPTYVNTVIYVIKCKNEQITDCYVGNTTNLKSRKAEHKYNCINENSKSHLLKVYVFIRNNGGWDNFEIIEIEKYPCNSKKEANYREHYWYVELGSTLNMISPVFNKDNLIKYANKLKEKRQIEIDKNKEEKEKKRKEHRKLKEEEWKKMRKLRYNKEKNTENMRLWREKNPEKNAKYCRAYYNRKKVKTV